MTQPMNTMQEQLAAELREAKSKLAQLEEQLDEKPDFGPGAGSTGAVTWEMGLARKEQLTAQVEELEAALARIENGTYGLCERCGAHIDPERLEILPTTTLCASCAS